VAGKFIPGVEFPASDPFVTAVGGTNLKTTTPPSPQPKSPVLTSHYVAESEYANPELPYDPYGTGANLSGGLWGSGSGSSAIFAKPAYQNLVNTGSSTRAVPDISMQMGGCPGGISEPNCPVNSVSYGIYYIQSLTPHPDGLVGFIGTSLSSPEFAGLLAVGIGLNKALGSPTGRLGNINPYIYTLAAQQYAAPGSNYFYHTGIPGYNGIVTLAAGFKGYSPILGVGTPDAHYFLGLPDVPEVTDPQTPANP
jgi:subtilase family serine protease